MKNISCGILIIAAFIFQACKKIEVATTPLSSLNIVNASVNLASIEANFSNAGQKVNVQYYSQISSINYASNAVYGVLANLNVPLTIVPSSDTMNTVYSGTFNLLKGGIYTLFLTGNNNSVDTLLIKESIPYHPDSSCGIRFVNLSYNGDPIVITQTVTPNAIDFSTMSYKQYSEFKNYSCTVANSSYVFQVRDALTNTILASYTLATPFFQNVTLAWIGQMGGTGAAIQKIMRINHY